MKFLLYHNRGNPYVSNLALALHEKGWLQEVVTSFQYDPAQHPLMERVLPSGLKKELARRNWNLPKDVPFSLYPFFEVYAQFVMKYKLYRFVGKDFQELLMQRAMYLEKIIVAKHLDNVEAVYGYEDMSAGVFQKCYDKGIKRFYDLPIAFYDTAKSILQEEAEYFPQYKQSLQSAQEPQWKVERKYKELELAQKVYVPSSFVKQSIPKNFKNHDDIIINPFGAPTAYFRPLEKKDKTFRVLFVGRVGPRKGVHYLLEAWQRLKLEDSELLLIGFNEFPDGILDGFLSSNKTIRYISSIPHKELNDYYSSASLFVFPSLVEGLAMVQLEALACGIPVIGTVNSGIDDVIEEGKEGFVLNVRDIDGLCEKITWAKENPDSLNEMAAMALQKANEYSWEKYRNRFVETVI